MQNFLPYEQHYQRLAKKPTSGGVIYFNDDNQVLLVKTHYRNYWTIPGGSSEAMESPFQTACRESEEELGAKLPVKSLLMVEHRLLDDQKESLSFVFYGGILSDDQIAKIQLQTEEIERFEFFDIDKAVDKKPRHQVPDRAY